LGKVCILVLLRSAFVSTVYLFICLFVVVTLGSRLYSHCPRSNSPPQLTGSKVTLDRTLDVFKLQELSEDPDPNSTLPFISHHTLNISRELDEPGRGGGGDGRRGVLLADAVAVAYKCMFCVPIDLSDSLIAERSRNDRYFYPSFLDCPILNLFWFNVHGLTLFPVFCSRKESRGRHRLSHFPSAPLYGRAYDD
jgi:hypothetical protein